jgi:hypothetical protein
MNESLVKNIFKHPRGKKKTSERSDVPPAVMAGTPVASELFTSSRITGDVRVMVQHEWGSPLQ